MKNPLFILKALLIVISLFIVIACGGSGSESDHFPLTSTVNLTGENDTIDNVNIKFSTESYSNANLLGPTETKTHAGQSRTWSSGSATQSFTINVGKSGTTLTSVTVAMSGDERNSGLNLKATWDGTTLTITHI